MPLVRQCRWSTSGQAFPRSAWCRLPKSRPARSASASQLVDGKVETRLVPAPVEYAALLPDGYENAKDLPLLFLALSARLYLAAQGP